MNTTNFNITLLQQNQSMKELTINEIVEKIAAFMNKVAQETVTKLPEQVQHGDLFLIADNPEEQLLKHANHLAIFVNDTWHFSPPHEGLIIFNFGIGKFLVFRKGAWEKLTEAM